MKKNSSDDPTNEQILNFAVECPWCGALFGSFFMTNAMFPDWLPLNAGIQTAITSSSTSNAIHSNTIP